MYSKLCVSLALLCFVAAPLISRTVSAEAMKWVDEKGKVHYGDRVPEKYRKSAEPVELQEAPRQGLDEEELKALKRKTSNYEKQVAQQRKAEEREKRKRAKKASLAPAHPHKPPGQPVNSAETCTLVKPLIEYAASTKPLNKTNGSPAK